MKAAAPEGRQGRSQADLLGRLQALGVAAGAGAVRRAVPLTSQLTPEGVALRLRSRRCRGLVWLDSSDASHDDGQFSILAWDPWGVLRARDGLAWMDTPQGRLELGQGDPLGALGAVMAALEVEDPPPDGLPFAGGAIGFLAYDLGRFIERIPRRTLDDLEAGDYCFALYDRALIHDHRSGAWHLAGTVEGAAAGRGTDRLEEARIGLQGILEGHGLVQAPAGYQEGGAAPPPLAPVAAGRGFSRSDYVAAVARAIDHIFAGDIYQVNLSQRFSAPVREDPLVLYRRLRDRTRAVFSGFLDIPPGPVLSLSPERFLRVRGLRVETCPIKGTRPRGSTPEQDVALAEELIASAKDGAELAMIVDLERNDLGRVCEAGSVAVSEHAALYTLATVHHTVTRVVGTLRADVGTAALLRATFPGGSITGAPKIRAMEIIEDMEPTRRGVYTGAVGYLDRSGDLDLNIAIRTVSLVGGIAHVQAGGGIVADSDPEEEYEETLTKARALLEAIGATF